MKRVLGSLRAKTGWVLLATLACSPTATVTDQADGPVPAKVTLELAPAANSFVVGTSGHVTARALDRANREMVWRAPRRIESSDTSVLQVNPDGSVLARRVGFSRLRLTWAGNVYVQDSVLVAVGFRGVGTVRFVPVEGGCWVIRTELLAGLEAPLLPNAFKTDGLRVRIAARPAQFGSFCMVGTLVELDSIRVEP